MAKVGLDNGPNGQNSKLIVNANSVAVAADGIADIHTGTVGQSDAFIIENGISGDDTFDAFETFDSLLTGKKIYDSNNDGYVWFGDNEVLDMDRTGPGASRAGADQFTFTGEMRGVRYLGQKEGYFAYADADVKRQLENHDFGLNVKLTEGTVGNDVFNAGTANNVYLYDNLLGLNLGGDTINNFGKNDYIITTRALFDSDVSQSVGFGKNGVLDLAGGVPGQTGGDVNGAGQIMFDAPSVSGRQVYYNTTLTLDVHGIDVTYYVYAGTQDSQVLV